MMPTTEPTMGASYSLSENFASFYGHLEPRGPIRARMPQGAKRSGNRLCDRRPKHLSLAVAPIVLTTRRTCSRGRRGSTTIGKTRFPDASQFDPLLHPSICPRGGGYGKIVIQFQLIRERKFLDGL